MITILLTAAVLGSTPAAQPPSFAVPSLTTSGIDASLAGPLVEHLAQSLLRAGAQVITSAEIAAVLGFERQRQLLGCGSDDASCMTELAGALGADALVLGAVARVGSAYQLQLRAVSGSGQGTLASWSGQVQRQEDIFASLRGGAELLARQTAAALGRTLKPAVDLQAQAEAASGRARLRSFSLPVGVAGVLLAGAGATALGFSRGDHAQLSQPSAPLTLAEAGALRDRGQTLQTLGWTSAAVGLTALAAAGTLAYLGAEPEASLTPSVTVGPNALGLSLGGHFP